MSFKRLRYDWTTIEPGERVYNKLKEVRVYEDWTPTFTGGHCDLIFNSTARVSWASSRPTPPEYSHGEWSTPGVCDEYTGRWEATANTNYGSYSMVKEFEVVEDCYVFARYDFTGSGSASYRHINVTINGSYAAEPGVDGTRKFSKGDRIRFTFVKTANPSAAAGDVAFVSMELPSYVEADVTPIGWTYYTLHWVGESGIGTKGEDVTVEHTAHLKDDITNKRMIITDITISDTIDTTHDATYLTSAPEYYSTFRIPFYNSVSDSTLENCSLISTNTYRNETAIKKLLNRCLKVNVLSDIKVSGRIRVESEGAANYIIHVAIMDADDLSDLSKAVDLQAIDATVGTGYNTVYFDFDCEIPDKKGILFYYCTSGSAAQIPRIYARNVSLQTTVTASRVG